MLKARLPVIAISAVRTGCGKSRSRAGCRGVLRGRGIGSLRSATRCPMAISRAQAVQRFASRADLDAAHCTNEEREEYEPHIAAGTVVFAGVDYAAILALPSARPR